MDIIKKTRKEKEKMVKSERASTTAFVISVCLLIIFVLVGVFIRNQNKVINQKKQLQIIQEKYNGDIENEMAQTYEEILQGEKNMVDNND